MPGIHYDVESNQSDHYLFGVFRNCLPLETKQKQLIVSKTSSLMYVSANGTFPNNGLMEQET